MWVYWIPLEMESCPFAAAAHSVLKLRAIMHCHCVGQSFVGRLIM